METIFKTWKRNTYFEGYFKLRDQKYWAHPIDFPTVFVAYGKAIKSGNWNSCTSINTPDLVISNYFDTIGYNKHENMFMLWEYCRKLENIKWDDVSKNKKNVIDLIALANLELKKLKTLTK